MITEIKARLETLGYVAKSEDDAFISFVLDKTNERIKIFTNQSVVPDELKYEVIDAVVGEFMLAKLATGGLDVERAVQSISEGDTSVTFASGSDGASILKRYYEGLALNVTKLIKFRVMVW